jgi:hypothetical protein
MKAGIRANELLLNDELIVDGYAEKQVVFLLQNLICGLTVQKNYWRNSVGPAMTSKITSEPIYAPNSGKILSFVPKVTSKNEGQEVYFDGPTSMPIDVRDFIWHQAATSLDTASRVAHRVWYDIGQLKELEAKGIYKDIDKLIEDPGSSGSSDALKEREQDLFQTTGRRTRLRFSSAGSTTAAASSRSPTARWSSGTRATRSASSTCRTSTRSSSAPRRPTCSALPASPRWS